MDIRDRMQLAADEADRALRGDVEPEPTPEGDGVLEADTDQPQADHEPEPEPAHQGPDSPDMQRQIDRLTAQLNDENSPTYKARYQSLQGMFNSETARLKGELDEAKRALEAKPAAAEIAPFTDEEYESLVEEVGQTAADILKSRGKDSHQSAELAELKAELATLKGETKAASALAERVVQSQASTDAERYAAQQARAIPDWEALMGRADKQFTDQNPKFTEFLNQASRGKTNFDWLAEYHGQGNLAEVKLIFDEGRAYVGAAVPKPAAKKPSAGVERYIEPDKTGKGAPVAAVAAEIIPHGEYNRFVDSVKKGTFAGTRDERAKLEARYDAAFRENRIR
jgi:hypothetical protein